MPTTDAIISARINIISIRIGRSDQVIVARITCPNGVRSRLAAGARYFSTS